MKKITILFMCLFLSGCSSIFSQIWGNKYYKSDVTFIMLNEDGSKKYPRPSDAVLFASLKWDYFSYRYDAGNAIVGMPIITYDHSDEMIKKLVIFLKWAKLPYEEQLITLNETQNSLPNNTPNKPNGKTSTTDFFLFHDNEKKPYLTFKRNPSYFSLFPDMYFSISTDSAVNMIHEIFYIQKMRRAYEQEHNLKQV